MRSLAYLLLACLALGICRSTAPLWAQGAPPGPLSPGPGARPEPGPPPPSPIRVQANEVVAPVIVRNRAGEMVLNLSGSDFHIFEDGVEQPIRHFGVGGEPLSIALLVENSARIAPLLPAIRKAAIVFAQPVLGQTGEAEILCYDQSVRVIEKFTTDPDSLQSAIASLGPGDYGANLYDAIERAISALDERPPGQRRILMVIGEAQDTGSRTGLGELLRHAEIANVTMYSVGLSTMAAAFRSPPESGPVTPTVPTGDPRQDEINREMQSGADLAAVAQWLVETGKNAIGPNALAVASKSTGGLSIHTLREGSIEKALDTIGGELHAEYTVGYTPAADVAGRYHEIKVTVDRPDVTLRTRPGYYLAGPQ